MKVYVVALESAYECSKIMGVYYSEDKAKARVEELDNEFGGQMTGGAYYEFEVE